MARVPLGRTVVLKLSVLVRAHVAQTALGERVLTRRALLAQLPRNIVADQRRASGCNLLLLTGMASTYKQSAHSPELNRLDLGVWSCLNSAVRRRWKEFMDYQTKDSEGSGMEKILDKLWAVILGGLRAGRCCCCSSSEPSAGRKTSCVVERERSLVSFSF